MTPASDSAETTRLLELVDAGDVQALDQLMTRHREFLLRVIDLRIDPRLRPRVDPSDVVQETQLEAARRIDDFLARRPMSFRLWLRKTANDRLIMARRQHLGAKGRDVGREVALPEGSSLAIGQQLLAAGASPSKQARRQELAGLVRQAVNELPPRDREIILLRNFEHLTNQEAADSLGIDDDAASQRYGRALLRLRDLLVKKGLSQPW